MSKTITFNVSLEEFYLESDTENISTELSNFIIGQVVEKIWDRIKSKVEDQIQLQVKDVVEKNFILKISNHIKEIITSDEIILKKVGGYDEKGNWINKDSSLKEYIENKFRKDSGWGSPNTLIEKIAKDFSIELKRRYDVLFASQIVNKMNEQGLLKDEAIQKLLATA